jgi:ribonuclease Z
MGKIVVLGTTAAIPNEEADFTHLAALTTTRTILVDTASNPFLSMRKAGLEPNHITDLILTHFHPDHVSGVPLLMMGMWLTGRKEGLRVYGLADTLERTQKLLELFNFAAWPDVFEIEYQVFINGGIEPLFEDEEICVRAAEVKHLIPTIGLRFEFKNSGKTLAYSCDTEPCSAVEKLAKNADFLLHESAGRSKGHSSAEQAGDEASKAGVRHLCLIHYPSGEDPNDLIKEARGKYTGEVSAVRDLQIFEMG